MRKCGGLQLKRRVSTFFYETFKRRTAADYGEFFTRGSGEERERVYPFVYARLFVMLFAVFSAMTLMIWLSANRISLPATIFFGGLIVNLPLCVLLYELNPDNDFSFASLMLTIALGGVLSSVLTTFGYYLFTSENEWLAAAYTGVLEEVAKGIALIAACLLLKKRTPYAGFLTGAAVGAGFSIIEDMGYIVYYGGGMHSVSGLVGMAVVRGICSFGSHILWSGLVGWAFAKFRLRARFWLVFVGCVVLHALWDIPLDFWWAFLVEFGCFFAAVIPSLCIIVTARIADGPSGIQLKIPVYAPADDGETYALKSNAIVVAMAITLSCLALLTTILPRKMTSDDLYFYSYDSLVEFVQDGKDYTADMYREYDSAAENYSLSIYEGRTVNAEQKVNCDGYDCIYRYFFVYDTESEELSNIELTEVVVETSDGENIYFVEKLYTEERGFLPYIIINEFVVECYYEEENSRFVAVANRRIDHTQNFIIGGAAAAVTAFYTTILVVLYKKSRRIKNG